MTHHVCASKNIILQSVAWLMMKLLSMLVNINYQYLQISYCLFFTAEDLCVIYEQ